VLNKWLQQKTKKMKPKGKILIIGGAEDRGDKDTYIQKANNHSERLEILKELIPKNGGRQRIEIITTASSIPEEMKITERKMKNPLTVKKRQTKTTA
jgi:cyanophycinase